MTWETKKAKRTLEIECPKCGAAKGARCVYTTPTPYRPRGFHSAPEESKTYKAKLARAGEEMKSPHVVRYTRYANLHGIEKSPKESTGRKFIIVGIPLTESEYKKVYQKVPLHWTALASSVLRDQLGLPSLPYGYSLASNEDILTEVQYHEINPNVLGR